MIGVKEIMQSPHLPELLDELNAAWKDEQHRRHEFWSQVDENVKAEFIQGEIIYHSPVYGRHWNASSNISRRLLPFVYDNNLGKVSYEKLMIRLTRNDYEPDICFWAKQVADKFKQNQSAYPPPDFIIEILSDSTRDRDYGIKMGDYADHGVQEYWIIDTDLNTIEQYLLSGGVFQLYQKLKEGRLTSEVIHGFQIEVKEIFE